MKMFTKKITLFALTMGICVAFSGSAKAEFKEVSEVGIKMLETITPEIGFVIDDIPKATIRYKLADDSEDEYHVILTVDDTDKQTVKLPSTGGKLKDYSIDYPIKKEGRHSLKIEISENRETKYQNTYSSNCVNSIKTGYTNRGFNTHFGHNTHFKNDAELLKASGAGVYRDTIYWHQVETYKGKYDFSGYDSRLEPILETGIDCILMIGGENRLYPDESLSNESRQKLILNDEQREAYADFVLETVKHYPQIKKIELLNEPGYQYTGTEYKKIVLEAAKKVKEYDSDIEIYIGSLFDNANDSRTPEPRQSFLKNMLDEEVYAYVDNISYHTYSCLGNYYGYADCDVFMTQSEAVLEEVKNEGGWKKVSMTETGWPNGDKENVPSEKQASELVKRMILGDDMNLSLITLYEFKCEPLLLEAGQGLLGVMSSDYELFPAYYSVKNYFKNTGRAQFIGKAYLTDGMKCYAYASDDDYFMIAWADNTNTNQSVNTDADTGAEYIFDANVKITDMYGNAEDGNVLKCDWQPRYIHNLTADFVAEKIVECGLCGFEGLKGKLSDIGCGEAYKSIEETYNGLLAEVSISGVDAFVDLCYNTGDDLINKFKNGKLNISQKELSSILSELNRAAEEGARLFACTECKEKKDISDISLKFAEMTEIIKQFGAEKLKFIEEPYREGKYILSKFADCEESDLINPITGDWYSLDCRGKLEISGESETDMISVRIEKGEEIIFLDSVFTDDDNKFSISYQLLEFGEYNIYLKTDTMYSKKINYARNGYVSVMDKMIHIEALRAEHLLKQTKALMSNLMIFPESETVITNGNKKYLCLEFADFDNVMFAALYSKDRMLSAEKVENNKCMIDISGIDEYEVKIFLWENMEDMKPTQPVYTIKKEV